MAFGERFKEVAKDFWEGYLVEGRELYFVKEKMKMMKICKIMEYRGLWKYG